MELLWIHDILETERCLIKTPQESEAEYIWNLITEGTTKYMLWSKWKDYSTTLDNIKKTRDKAKKWESWDAAIYDKKSWRVIWRCWINKISSEIPSFELWYWIAEEYYGQGIIPECVKKYLHFAFVENDYEKVIIRCDSKNINSERVALKCGLVFEGEFKNHERIRWELRDTKYFGITREDYLNKVNNAWDIYST